VTRALVLDVADLLRRPGSRREVRTAVALDDLAVSTAQVPAGAAIDLDLVVESLSSSIVVAGSVAAPWTGACRRCLEDTSGVAVADVREIFEAHPTEGETYPLTGEQVDLEPMVRDAVLLALPLAPLCEEGCRGPAPESATLRTADDAEAGAATGEDAPRDPRWAALDDLDL
jgi:uncharacterized protein